MTATCWSRRAKSLAASDFFGILAGRENADLLFTAGRIEVEGDLSLALKMRKLFRPQR
jgi:predicted lipid carrier protein YhbT